MFNTFVQDRYDRLMSPRENHRERLLTGALECLREKGYARTTARDIAAASGSNLGSIGYHFGSVETLLNEAIRKGLAEWVEQLEQIAFTDPRATPLERIQAAWAGLTNTVARCRPLMIAFIEAIAQAEHSSELRRQLADLFEETRATVARMLRASVGDAGLTEEQVRGFASFLIAAADGLLLQWIVDPQRAPSSEDVISGLGAALPLAMTRPTELPARRRTPSGDGT